MTGVGFLVMIALRMPAPAMAADSYSWSANVAVAPPGASRQQGETALTTDAQGRVWLSFIDAHYRRVRDGFWIGWPRKLRLLLSADAGKTFRAQPDLAEPAGDQALASAPNGDVHATYVQYFSSRSVPGERMRIVLRNLLSERQPNSECLPWDTTTEHDQSSVHIGRNGAVHVIGVDNRYGAQSTLLYARSIDGGATCDGQRRLESIGQLPQVVGTAAELMIIGPVGYYVSQGGGATFPPRNVRSFGEGLVRAAVSPDRRRVYVAGDSTAGGLAMHVSTDGGTRWNVTRVDDAGRASAWRYPAVHVDQKGRVHVVWMDDRSGFGALYHAYSDDGGDHFSPSTRVSDTPFAFAANAPPPPPATQDGTWIGDYLSLTTARDQVIVAWSDQRAGNPHSVVQVAVGNVSSAERRQFGNAR
jgi:hypothetical protein